MSGLISKIGTRAFISGVRSMPSILELAMKSVQNKSIVWTRSNTGQLEANISAGVKAYLVPGSMDSDTKVYVTDGKSTVKKIFPEMWLKNWTRRG